MKQNHSVIGKIHISHIKYESFLVNKNRTIRVWTPFSYNPKSSKKYNVIYMFDGQNLFDKYTSFANKEWEIDETLTYLEESEHIQPSIVVGLDNSEDRLSEYLPRFSNIAIGNLAYKGEETLSFLIEKVIPYIEAHYNVKKNRNSRSICGSSMGGLMSLQAGILYPHIFKNIYSLSPAFAIFKYGLSEHAPAFQGTNNEEAFEYVINHYSKQNMINNFKLCFCAGGKGIEKNYTKYPTLAKTLLTQNGWDEKNIYTYIDKKEIHSEDLWAQAFYYMYKLIYENK